MFRSISAINFFSWKNLQFDFNSGVTLITGANLDDNTSEGAGKSSIPNALCWGLYGTLPKDVNIDDVITTGEKSCCVVIILEDGTKITRLRKPNTLSIEVNGVIQQGKDSKETQTLINNLLGMSFDTFCQSVYFAQNYSNKFITATQENKAKILSELQDLSVFDKASKQSSEKAKDIKNNVLLKLTMAQGYTESEINHIKSEIKTYEQLSHNFDTDKNNKLEEIMIRSYNMTLKITDLENQMKSINFDNIENKMQESNDIEKQLIEVRNQLYHINQLKTYAVDHTNCPTCGQDLPGSENIIIPDDAELKQRHQILSTQKGIVDLEVASLLTKKNYNSLLEDRLKLTIEQKNQVVIDIENTQKMENPHILHLDQLKVNKQGIYLKLDKINEDIVLQTQLQNRYEYLKDGFKQIKSYIFQSLLSELNRSTNRYLSELFEVPAYITFDNISDDGDISKIKTTVLLNGYERSLGLLSGGQFRRVQLAVDFALSDIVSQRSKSPINIRILDESFKDLSEQSMERLVSVLQKMSGSTILIEHNSIIKNIVNRVYKVQLQDGISTHE